MLLSFTLTKITNYEWNSKWQAETLKNRTIVASSNSRSIYWLDMTLHSNFDINLCFLCIYVFIIIRYLFIGFVLFQNNKINRNERVVRHRDYYVGILMTISHMSLIKSCHVFT